MALYWDGKTKPPGPRLDKEICQHCKKEWTLKDEKNFVTGCVHCPSSVPNERWFWEAFICAVSHCPYLLEHQMLSEYDILTGLVDMETANPAEIGKGSLVPKRMIK
jgi:hypothetical protein